MYDEAEAQGKCEAGPSRLKRRYNQDEGPRGWQKRGCLSSGGAGRVARRRCRGPPIKIIDGGCRIGRGRGGQKRARRVEKPNHERNGRSVRGTRGKEKIKMSDES